MGPFCSLLTRSPLIRQPLRQSHYGCSPSPVYQLLSLYLSLYLPETASASSFGISSLAQSMKVAANCFTLYNSTATLQGVTRRELQFKAHHRLAIRAITAQLLSHLLQSVYASEVIIYQTPEILVFDCCYIYKITGFI